MNVTNEIHILRLVFEIVIRIGQFETFQEGVEYIAGNVVESKFAGHFLTHSKLFDGFDHLVTLLTLS